MCSIKKPCNYNYFNLSLSYLLYIYVYIVFELRFSAKRQQVAVKKTLVCSQTTHTLTTLSQCLAQLFSVGGGDGRGGGVCDRTRTSLTRLQSHLSHLWELVAFFRDLQQER